jgi:hypothetical protein
VTASGHGRINQPWSQRQSDDTPRVQVGAGSGCSPGRPQPWPYCIPKAASVAPRLFGRSAPNSPCAAAASGLEDLDQAKHLSAMYKQHPLGLELLQGSLCLHRKHLSARRHRLGTQRLSRRVCQGSKRYEITVLATRNRAAAGKAQCAVAVNRLEGSFLSPPGA